MESGLSVKESGEIKTLIKKSCGNGNRADVSIAELKVIAIVAAGATLVAPCAGEVD